MHMQATSSAGSRLAATYKPPSSPCPPGLCARPPGPPRARFQLYVRACTCESNPVLAPNARTPALQTRATRLRTRHQASPACPGYARGRPARPTHPPALRIAAGRGRPILEGLRAAFALAAGVYLVVVLPSFNAALKPCTLAITLGVGNPPESPSEPVTIFVLHGRESGSTLAPGHLPVVDF
jgi:hypothetical protein